jgi:hypothetical protein
LVFCGTILAADPPPPGALQLLPGYTHVPKQGFDSVAGEISKKDGLTIQYEIGRVRKPGAFALGGDFSDRAAGLRDAEWLKKQVVNGQTMNVAYSKDNMLYVSFPESGVNFHVKAKTPEEVAEVLLMLLTYPAAKKEP